MKKLTLPVVVVLPVAMLLPLMAGCGGGRTAISVADFVKAAEEKGLTVADTADTYTDEIFQSSRMATSPDGWKVVFFDIDSAEHAKTYFDTCKSFMESKKTGAGTSQITQRDNYALYSQTNGGRFMYVCYVDDTMVYVDVEDTHKSAVQDFVNSIGY